jgi:beta-glucanase (GH16 family)
VFQDEFDRAGPDPGKAWRTTYGDGRDPGLSQRTIASNDELQLYVDRDYGARIGVQGLEPFGVKGGVVSLRAQPAPPGQAAKLSGYRYVSGLISTLPTVAQTYGHFEVRARLPRGKGLWPAIWMLPADQTWPPEIDIVESIGDPRIGYVTAHSKTAPSRSVEVKVGDEGFHTYAVSWDAQWLKWYLDGVETARQATPADMHKPMYLIANLAVGGKWPGVPDASTRFPASLDLDFVRIYQFQKPGG